MIPSWSMVLGMKSGLGGQTLEGRIMSFTSSSIALRPNLPQGIWVWPAIWFGIPFGRPSLPGDLGARSTKESGLAQEHSMELNRGI